ncbi:hypothetical protein BTVI_76160 [Pitangus sulphuratus]|nr:hypothetical protein BTVI_76160 [Pitangus sulphuratus]
MPSRLPQPSPLPWGPQQRTQGLTLPLCQGLTRILKSGWSVSYVSRKPGSGCEGVGQQEVPQDSRDTALGGPGDVPFRGGVGEERVGELGRAKCKVNRDAMEVESSTYTDFISCDRAGRRNAVHDIQRDATTISMRKLTEDLGDLAVQGAGELPQAPATLERIWPQQGSSGSSGGNESEMWEFLVACALSKE